uniref:hypothetical protein n=1 Tax=Sphingomonas bacterium TaxID=1895847 RepID=UPI00261CE7D1|nr:hypothetical protein [Sphingomonas bacterium]
MMALNHRNKNSQAIDDRFSKLVNYKSTIPAVQIPPCRVDLLEMPLDRSESFQQAALSATGKVKKTGRRGLAKTGGYLSRGEGPGGRLLHHRIRGHAV